MLHARAVRVEARHARDVGRTSSKTNRPSNAVAKDSKRSVSANPGARVASSSGLVPRLPPRRANGTVYVAPPKSVAFLRFETVPAACA